MLELKTVPSFPYCQVLSCCRFIGRIMRHAHPLSVCPVRTIYLTPKQKSIEKPKSGVKVSQGSIVNPCTTFLAWKVKRQQYGAYLVQSGLVRRVT